MGGMCSAPTKPAKIKANSAGFAISKSVRALPRVSRRLVLEHATDDELLAARLCDLPLQLAGTLMERRLRRLHRELNGRGISVLPHAWLAEEFFNPDGVLGFAIPFYLAHPRLICAKTRAASGRPACV